MTADRMTEIIDEMLAIRESRGRTRHVAGVALVRGHHDMILLARACEAIFVKAFLDLEAEMAVLYQAEQANQVRARA